MGFKVSEKGIEIDKDRINAILELEYPQNKKELLRFLGLLKYLAKFLPNLSQITAPLRKLTCDNVIWNWEKVHSERVDILKQMLTSPPCLKHYDINEPVVIQCDSSQEGMGACLLQNGQPIAFASRALTDTEKRWACIERELGAILFAAEKFKYYIYGKENTLVHTDHKPLVSIFKKDINKVSSRLQRLLLRLMKYQLIVSYLPGKQMFIADFLSRSFLKHPVVDNPKNNFIVHSIEKKIPMSEQIKSQILSETKSDRSLSVLLKFLSQGWPKNIKKLSSELQKFYQIKDELSVENNLIFYGDRLVIPTKLRVSMLTKLHGGHIGINKCRSRARETIFWPNISEEISNFILNCDVCLRFRQANPKLPLKQHKIPDRPWEKIAMDILEFKGYLFLSVIDYFSNWIELKKLKNKTAEECIKALNSIFSFHGFPCIIIADNNPFSSILFKQFLNNHNITLTTSSPNYPRSNGLAEKSVNICKTMLKKCFYENNGNLESLDFYLLSHRNTPIPDLGLSPAQMLLNRRLKDDLPVVDSMLKPVLINRQKLKQKKLCRRKKQKFYYDRTTKNLAGGKVNDNVLFKNKEQWENGIIVKKCKEPRSFVIRDNFGNDYRRTQQHLILRKPVLPNVRKSNCDNRTPVYNNFVRDPYFLRSRIKKEIV